MKLLDLAEIKNKSIKHYLKQKGIEPVSIKGYYGYYIAPYRNDTKPSLRVNYKENLWYDYGIAKGGTIIDMIMVMNNWKFKEALSYIENDLVDLSSLSFHRPTASFMSRSIEIKKVKDLEHQALLSYLEERKVDLGVAVQYCKEIHYSVAGEGYFAIGFKNRSNGYDLRNKYFKGCNTKDISILEGNLNEICIFEGFIDFLSYKTLKMNCNKTYIVLNSAANYTKLDDILNEKQDIELYLDNDNAGYKVNHYLEVVFNAKSMGYKYSDYKDLNDYLINADSPSLG